MHGRFFYASSSSQPIAFAMVHSFILNLGPTNQQTERFTFLRRLMAMWYIRYSQEPIFDTSSFPHVPDVTTENGLKDLMAIANILELATVLDRRSYISPGVHWMERVEMGSGRSMSRRLLAIIGQHFVIHIGGRPVAPSVVFQRSLVEFAAAVVVYKEDMSIACKVPGCPPIKVKEKMVALFESNHPRLLPKLHSLIDSRTEYLSWTGPPISITKRTNDHKIFRQTKMNTPGMLKNTPLRDFLDNPIYIRPASESNSLMEKGSNRPEVIDDDDVDMEDAESKDEDGHVVDPDSKDFTDGGPTNPNTIPLPMNVDTEPDSKAVTDVGPSSRNAIPPAMDVDANSAENMKRAKRLRRPRQRGQKPARSSSRNKSRPGSATPSRMAENDQKFAERLDEELDKLTLIPEEAASAGEKPARRGRKAKGSSAPDAQTFPSGDGNVMPPVEKKGKKKAASVPPENPMPPVDNKGKKRAADSSSQAPKSAKRARRRK
jgi:hypothetical protein